MKVFVSLLAMVFASSFKYCVGQQSFVYIFFLSSIFCSFGQQAKRPAVLGKSLVDLIEYRFLLSIQNIVSATTKNLFIILDSRLK